MKTIEDLETHDEGEQQLVLGEQGAADSSVERLLEVVDDGIGIPSYLEDSTGLGLNIMKHRCGLFDGEISINPDGDRGTKVSCRFPLKAEENTQ